MRSGSSQRGNVHFARETSDARLRRLWRGTRRFDVVRALMSGFVSVGDEAVIAASRRPRRVAGRRSGGSHRTTKVKAAIAAIDDDWAPISLYTRGGEASMVV